MYAAKFTFKYKQVVYVHNKNKENFAFKQWFNLLNFNRNMMKCRHLRHRKTKVLRGCLSAIFNFAYGKVQFKTQMRKLLQLRAKNIARKAFVLGLKA